MHAVETVTPRRPMFGTGWRRSMLSTLLLIACTSISSCGDGLASVTGLVTFDGQPIAGGSEVHAMVCFTPVGGGPPGIGEIDSSGHFSLATGSAAGIRPGKYLVSV